MLQHTYNAYAESRSRCCSTSYRDQDTSRHLPACELHGSSTTKNRSLSSWSFKAVIGEILCFCRLTNLLCSSLQSAHIDSWQSWHQLSALTCFLSRMHAAHMLSLGFSPICVFNELRRELAGKFLAHSSMGIPCSGHPVTRLHTGHLNSNLSVSFPIEALVI